MSDKPWLAGNLQVAAETAALLHRTAEAAAPMEACGLLVGPRAGLVCDAFVHLGKGERFAFATDPLRVARAFDEAEAGGRAIKALWHSHGDAPAEFSRSDEAAFLIEGRPLWPWAFAITGVRAGQATKTRCWGITAGVLRPGQWRVQND